MKPLGRLIPLFLNGNIEGADYVGVVPPNLAFAAAITWPRDFDILGYAWSFQATATLNGPNPPGTSWPFPPYATMVIGSQQPQFSINNPLVGQASTQQLATLLGAANYVPASGARPETIVLGASESITFQDENIIRVLASSPISMYLSLANTTVWDTANASAILYVREVVQQENL